MGMCHAAGVIGCKQRKPILAYLSRKKNNWKDTWDITEAPESLKNKAQETGRKRQARLQLVAQSQNHRGKDPAAAAGEWRPLQLNSTTPAPTPFLPRTPGASPSPPQLGKNGLSTVPASLVFRIPKQSLGLTLAARHAGKVSISPVEFWQFEVNSVSHKQNSYGKRNNSCVLLKCHLLSETKCIKLTHCTP